MAPPIDPLASIEPLAAQGAVVALGIPNSQDSPRLVFAAPYHTTVAIADIIEPSVLEAVEGMLPTLVPPYVNSAANAAVQQLAVLLTGSTMTGPLYLNGLPTQPTQAADKSYVDMMVATAGVPEVPPVPAGQSWVRQTGQWAPISQQAGVFLPLSGGTMTGNIAMSGNTINGLAAVPNLPSGAAPAQWVLNQISAVSLYQGTWNADTNVPDLTSGSLHVNGYMWIAKTVNVNGIVVSQPILGLQGMTVYNGDTIIYSTVEGKFDPIHAGGLTAPQADARYVMLTGSQMSGALLLNANATAPLQAVTLQQLQAFVPTGSLPEAPADGQVYARNGQTHAWTPSLPLVGGILTGALTLNANAAQPLNAVPLQQLTSTLGAYVPLAGNVTVTGPLTMGVAGTFTLGANAAAALQAVPLQQLTSTLASYASAVGVVNGSNAAAGIVGEYLTATTASTPLPNGTPGSAILLSLPAGDWDVEGNVSFAGSAAVLIYAVAGISTTSGVLPANNLASGYVQIGPGSGLLFSSLIMPTGVTRLSLSVTTTVYLVAQAGFSSGTATAGGVIRARRVR